MKAHSLISSECCSDTGTSPASHRQGRVQHLLTGFLLTILSTLLWMVNQLVPLPFNSSRHFQLVPAHSTRVPCFGPQGTSCGSHLLHFLLLPPLTMEVTSLSENQESLHLNAIDQKPGNLHQICILMQVMSPLLIFSSQRFLQCVSVYILLVHSCPSVCLSNLTSRIDTTLIRN